MTMDIRFALDNYRTLRAAWTAMDQTYGAVQTGQALGPIDNTSQGSTRPFATPEGFVVAKIITDPTTDFKAVLNENAETNEVIASFMGTNGWEDTKGWNGNLTRPRGICIPAIETSYSKPLQTSPASTPTHASSWPATARAE